MLKKFVLSMFLLACLAFGYDINITITPAGSPPWFYAAPFHGVAVTFGEISGTCNTDQAATPSGAITVPGGWYGKVYVTNNGFMMSPETTVVPYHGSTNVSYTFTATDTAKPVLYFKKPVGTLYTGITDTARTTMIDNAGTAKQIKYYLSYDNGSNWSLFYDSSVTSPKYIICSDTSLVQVKKAHAFTPTTVTTQFKVMGILIDWAGNIDTAYSQTLSVLDTVKPACSITAPVGSENWAINTAHAITWTASDNIGLVSRSIYLSTDGGSTYPTKLDSAAGNAGTWTWNIPTMTATATCRAKVIVYDLSGNSKSSASTSNFTLVAPPTWVSVTIPATAEAGVSINVSGTANSVSGIRAYVVYVNGVKNDSSLTSPHSTSIPYCGGCTDQVTYRAYDIFGNYIDSTKSVVVTDNLDPALSITSGTVPNDTVFKSKSVTFNAYDYNGGTVSTQYKINGSGTYQNTTTATTVVWTPNRSRWPTYDTIFILTTDQAGRTKTVNARYWVYKALATVTLNNLNQTWDGTTKTVTATTNPVGRVCIVSYKYNGMPVSPPIDTGHYAVTATVSPLDTVYTGTASGTLVISPLAFPTVSVVTPGTLEAGVATTLTWTESGTVTSRTVEYNDGTGWVTLTGAVAGSVAWTPAYVALNANNQFRVTLTNVAGSNVSTSNAFTVKDATTPVVAISLQPVTTDSGIPVKIKWSASDANGGSIAHRYYKLDAGSFIEVIADSVLMTPVPGVHTITAKVEDLAANSAEATSNSFTINSIRDTIPPVVTISLQPASVDLGTSVKVKWTASDTNGSIAHQYYRLDTGTFIEVMADSIVLTPAIGVHTVTVKVADLAGNSDSVVSNSFTVDPIRDTIPPKVTISLQPASVNLGTSVKVKWTASDTNGSIAHRYYRLDAGTFTEIPTDSITLTPAVGVHTITIKVEDLAGNSDSVVTNSFTVSGPTGVLTGNAYRDRFGLTITYRGMQYGVNAGGGYDIMIYNATGRAVYHKGGMAGAGVVEQVSLSGGFYFARLRQGNRILNSHFVIR